MGLFNISFIVFFIMFLLSFLSFGAVFAFIIVYIVKQKSKDDRAPCLTVGAKVIDKRTVSHRHHHPDRMSHRHYYHYVTFELQDGQRTELRVARDEFDLLCVAEVGMLTLQGTRFISFDKNSGVAH